MRKLSFLVVALVVFVSTFSLTAKAQEFDGTVKTVPAPKAQPLITSKIDESKTVPLMHKAPEINGANEIGRAPADMKLGMQLDLRRSLEQQQALDLLKQQVATPSNKQFGQTLTPTVFAATFGLAESDLMTIQKWLTDAGFTVGNVDNGRMAIDFTGTVEQVEKAFHTEIREYTDENGAKHYANADMIKVPEALVPAVGRISGLQNFTAFEPRNFDGPVTDFAAGTTNAVSPATTTATREVASPVVAALTGEALHDASFTASNAATVFSGYQPNPVAGGTTQLNVRLGGGTYPTTGSLQITDQTGKNVAYIPDVTACTSYNDGLGHSCTVTFTPTVAMTSFLTATYSGDANNRGEVQMIIHPDVGTGASIPVVTENPIAYQLSTTGSLIAGTVYTSISWLGTGTQPTGTITIEDEADASYTFGEITLPTAGNTTITTGTTCTVKGTGNYACTYGCTGSLTSRYIACTITNANLGEYLYYYEDNEQYAVYSGDTNYASETGLTWIFGYDVAPTVQPTVSATAPSPATVTYGAGTTETNSVTITGNSTQGAIYANGALFENNNPQLGMMSFSNPTSCTATNGICTFTNTFTVPANANPGTYTVTYAYSGNTYTSALYKYATTTGTITVVQQTPTFGPIVATPSSVFTGSSTAVTISANLGYTGNGAVPGTTAALGSVPTFVLNGVTYNATCTGTSSPLSCTASVPAATVAALAAGTYTITGSWAGDVNYGSVTATPTGTLTVGNITATFTATPTSETYGSNGTVTLKDILTVANTSPNPTGTVTFANSSGVTTIGSVNLSACTETAGSPDNTFTCSFTWTPPATLAGDNAGVYTVSSTYSGDTNYSQIISGVTFTINKATTTLATTNPIIVSSGNGGNAVFTTTLTYTGVGIPPTGNVTLTNGGNIFSEALLPLAGQTTSSGSITPPTGYVSNYSCQDNAPSALTVTCNITTVDLYAATTSGNSYTFVGNYSGDTNYGTSTYSTTLTSSSNHALTTNTTTATPTSVVYGQGTSVKYTTSLTGASATHTLVAAQYELSGTPVTGSPIFTTLPAATNSTCTETNVYTFVCNVSVVVPATTPASATPYTVTETFLGNSYYAAGNASSEPTVTVTAQTLTAGAGSVSPTPVTWQTSQAVTLSQVINWTGSGNAPTAANFSFSLNGQSYAASCALGTNSYTCTGTVPAATVAALNGGSYPATLSFTTDNNYAAISSLAVGTLVISPATLSSIALAAVTPGSPSGGVASTTLTATIGPALNGVSVTFTDTTTGNVIGTAVTSGGVASIVANTAGTGSGQSSKPSGGLNNFTAQVASSANYSAVGPSSPVTPVYYNGVLYSLTAGHDFSVCYANSNGTGSVVPCAPYVSPQSGGTLDGSQICGAGINGYSCTTGFGVTVYNFTSSAQAIGVNLVNAASGAFSSATNCPANLAAGATCQYAFYYKPPYGDGNSTTVGLYEAGSWTASVPAGVLTGIGDTAFDRSGPTTFPATLSGYAVLTATNPVSVTPLSLTFGPQAQGAQSATQDILVTNNGTAAIGMTYTPPVPAGFIVTNNCPSSLSQGASCSIGIAYKSSTVGTSSGYETITAAGQSPIQVAVSGTVVSNVLSLSTASVNMGSVNDGSTATQSVTLTNSSSASATISLATSGSTEFTYNYGSCGSSLAAGASCTVSATFAPTAAGAVSNVLTVTSSIPVVPGGTGSGPYMGTVTFSGTGVSGTGKLTVGTSTHNFGNVSVNSTGTAYGVTMTNSTGAAVTLALGPVSAPFTAATNCGSTLANGASCQFVFNFTPSADGFVSAVYSISANGGAVPLFSTAANGDVSGITLEGTGVN